MTTATFSPIAQITPWPFTNNVVITTDSSVIEEETTILSYGIDLLAAYLKYRDSQSGLRFEEFLAHNFVGPNNLEIEDQFIAKADQIRTHFSAKFVHLSLLNKPLSQFRQRMYEVISKPKEIDTRYIGILCKMPSFYQEDIELDQILEQCESYDPRVIWQSNLPISDSYEFICVTRRNAKRSSAHRYWFKNSANQLATLWVDISSSAVPILNMVLRPGKKFNITSAPLTIELLGLVEPVHALMFVGDYKIKECA